MVNPNSYMSLEDFRAWFMSVGKPFWTLYNWSDPNKNPPQTSRMLENTNVRNVEESWDMLATQIEALSSQGGSFTVRVDHDNKFRSAFFARLTLHASSPRSGIAGMAGSIVPAGYVSREELERILEVKELQRRNEDLEDQLDSAINGGPLMSAWNRLVESDQLAGIVQVIANKIFGPSVSLSGIEDVLRPDVHADNESLNDEMIIQKAFHQIEKVFPNVTLFMQRIGAWVEANPDMARQIFKQTEQSGQYE